MRVRDHSRSGLTLEDIAAAIELDQGSPELRTEFLLDAARRIRRDVAALGTGFAAEPVAALIPDEAETDPA